jgi:peptidyl-prolyl cis-trans isomerase A (cyclophilin A)/peptidyl-prolyl cis-trans isomerase B (cyclophilin B)
MKYAHTLLLAAALLCGLFLAAPATEASAAGPNPVVIMETSMGRIIVMLSPKDAPKTVENFLKYVDAGFYDKTVFHRVVKQKVRPGSITKAKPKSDSMNIVQGGGYNLQMKKKQPLYPPLVNEAAIGLLNAKGTIAMARTDAPDSATSEFFFNMGDNPVLDRKQTFSKVGVGNFDASTQAGYCAFGKVIRGMDVIEKIHNIRTVSRGLMDDVPVDTVILKKAYRAK